MPWVRIDDHFNEHTKLAPLGATCWGLWVAGLAYCNRNLTDGFIPRAVARTLADMPRPDRTIRRLVDASVWRETADGYWVHDYLDHQPSREKVLAQRERDANRKRSGAQIVRLDSRRDSGRNPDGA